MKNNKTEVCTFDISLGKTCFALRRDIFIPLNDEQVTRIVNQTVGAFDLPCFVHPSCSLVISYLLVMLIGGKGKEIERIQYATRWKR